MLASLAGEHCQPYWTDRLVQRYPGFVLHFADVHGFGMALAPAATPTLHKRDYLSAPVMG